MESPAGAPLSRPAARGVTRKLIIALCIGAFLVISLFIISIFALAFHILFGSDAAKLAISTASKNPELIARIGEPLKTGWYVSGRVETTTVTGHAELAFPISGPRGAGTLYVEARKKAGIWQLQLLQFGDEFSAERLNLLPAAATGPQPDAGTEQ